MQKQFCKHGHDLSVVGSTKSNGCNQCSRDKSKRWREEHRKEYYANNKKRILARNAKYRNENHWRVTLWNRRCFELPFTRFNARVRRAKYRGHEWAIDLETYFNLISCPCYYCGEYFAGVGVNLGRCDNKKGYILENVVPCCTRCNRMKNVYVTSDEFKIMMEALLEYRKLKTASKSPLKVEQK